VKYVVLIVTAVFILAASPVFAQSGESAIETTGDASDRKKLFVTFNYGPTASWLTRIINQTGRSNFVLKDFMPGLYFTTELQNLPLITPEVRLAVYYPLVSTFNRMEQVMSSPLRMALDLFSGVRFELQWLFFRFSGGPGLHVLYLSSERWHYVNLGFALTAGIEMALNPGWSLMIDGFASIDNGNLGSNQQMEPFNIVYQYQTSIGVRYSKKKRNETVLIKPKGEKQEDAPFVILDR